MCRFQAETGGSIGKTQIFVIDGQISSELFQNMRLFKNGMERRKKRMYLTIVKTGKKRYKVTYAGSTSPICFFDDLYTASVYCRFLQGAALHKDDILRVQHAIEKNEGAES